MLFRSLKTKDTTKALLKNKAFQDLLTKMDAQQSVSFATVGEALTKSPLSGLGPVKDLLPKIAAASGGFTLADGIKMSFTIGTKGTAEAKEIKEKIDEGLNTANVLISLAAMQQKELAPLAEIIKSIKITAKETNVTVKGEVDGDTLKNLRPKDQ